MIYETIPPSILIAIDQFVQHGRTSGSFVMSCLENDLRGAVKRADPASLAALPAIVDFLNMEVPSPAWGNKAAVDRWAVRGGYVGQHDGTECPYESVEAFTLIEALRVTSERWCRMNNLAGLGTTLTDEAILTELTMARINVCRRQNPSDSEVSTHLTGELPGFMFRRAWAYWVATGRVPLAVAEAMYADPVGLADIRVSGHCGRPAPVAPWLECYDAEGKLLVVESQREEAEHFRDKGFITIPESWRFVPDIRAAAAHVFVEMYHIDSMVGLRVFADYARKVEPVAGLPALEGVA